MNTYNNKVKLKSKIKNYESWNSKQKRNLIKMINKNQKLKMKIEK